MHNKILASCDIPSMASPIHPSGSPTITQTPLQVAVAQEPLALLLLSALSKPQVPTPPATPVAALPVPASDKKRAQQSPENKVVSAPQSWTAENLTPIERLRHMFMPALNLIIAELGQKYFSQPGLDKKNCIQIGAGLGDFLRKAAPKLHQLMTHTDCDPELLDEFLLREDFLDTAVCLANVRTLDEKFHGLIRIFGSLVLDTLSYEHLREALKASHRALAHNGVLIHIVDANALVDAFIAHHLKQGEIVFPLGDEKYWRIDADLIKRLRKEDPKLADFLLKNILSLVSTLLDPKTSYVGRVAQQQYLNILKAILGEPKNEHIVTLNQAFVSRVRSAIADEKLAFKITSITKRQTQTVSKQHLKGSDLEPYINRGFNSFTWRDGRVITQRLNGIKEGEIRLEVFVNILFLQKTE
jgi:hypothetical protein